MPKPALLALALTAALLAGCDATRPTPTDPATSPTQDVSPSPATTAGPTATLQAVRGRTSATVVRVVDGDTILVDIDGEERTVRYIGIDTPETVHPSRPVEEFGREASDRNKALVEGEQVWLEKDVSETDRFGRLLRYVWLDEDTMVNNVLVSEGLAQASTFPPDVKYQELFNRLQAEARENKVGLWSIEPDATATPTAANVECDPSYSGACIPPYPPDLNCGDVTERRFKVKPPDPHNFDTDGDGIGCEGQ